DATTGPTATPSAPSDIPDTSAITPEALRGGRRLLVASPVFAASALLIFLFVLATVLFTEQAGAVFAVVESWIVSTLGWFYLLAVAVFLVFAIALAVSDFGNV